MTNEKITEILDRCKGRFGRVQIHIDTEENYLLMPLTDLIELLEKQMQNCGNCRHANHSPYNNIIYCLKLSRVMLRGNCCRDWEEEDET